MDSPFTGLFLDNKNQIQHILQSEDRVRNKCHISYLRRILNNLDESSTLELSSDIRVSRGWKVV